MKSNVLIGAAGFALLATAGAAQAADPLPIVAGATLPMVAEAESKVSIEISDTLNLRIQFGDPINIFKELDFDVEIESASGWNLEIEGNAGIGFQSPVVGFGGDVYGHFSRSIGGFEIGAFFEGGGGCTIPGGCGGGVGGGGFFAYEYENDRLLVRSELYALLFPGFDLWSWTELEFDVNDRLEIWAGLVLDLGGFEWFEIGVEFDVNERLLVGAELDFWSFTDWRIELWVDYDVNDMFEIGAWIEFDDDGFNGIGAWAELDLGDIEPYVGGWFDNPGDWGAWVGVDLEDQIRTGPYSLIGNVELGIAGCCGPNFRASIGIQYKIGEDDDDDD